ncbi:cyclin-domain-containing protein [Daedalea quercina L-15889]|uniref:Cyclin-domain-containing protein n=1 Tax=Daedalea quercina L-15889 TaxID=1314783 RepID=A0A165U888_9APHY|nr:cyclin-domain-containing protein [Daedalea quercina L-15889]
MPQPGHSHPPEHSREHPPIWRTLTSASRHSLSTTSSLAFHARNVPTIALEGYLNRIHKYCPASNEVFVSLLVYLDRMSKLAQAACGKMFPIDMYNIHRLIIAGVTVASKFFSDVFYTNSRYAKVGGLPLTELNQLELHFLLLNDFNLPISCEEMEYYTTMVDLQSKIPEDVDLSPYLPSSSSDPRRPVCPTDFFAAVDAYFGQHHTIRPSVPPRRFDDDNLSLCSISSRRSTLSISDVASEAGTETDVDGSTDDEPTIRPPHSASSSETMSLHSVASGDADSIFTEDSDISQEENGDVSMQRPSEGTPDGRDYRMRTPS